MMTVELKEAIQVSLWLLVAMVTVANAKQGNWGMVMIVTIIVLFQLLP